MILAVDIGNTTIAATFLERNLDVVFTKKTPSGENFNLPTNLTSRVESVVLSSVVPTLTEPICAEVREIVGISPRVITCGSYHGILRLAVSEPEKVGLDRIADSAFAAVKFPLPAVTVDLGTATTFNVIGEGGIFLGGIIAAGIGVSLSALSEHAAQLPKLEPVAAKRLIGKNTAECMLSGAVIGAAAMIDGIVSRIEAELGASVTLILTGGAAEYVKPHCAHDFVHEPHLLAKGLALAADESVI